jgi:PAS domain S-box-containing protein
MNYNGCRWYYFLISLIIMMAGCNQKRRSIESTGLVDSLIAVSETLRDSGSPVESLDFLDKQFSGVDVSPLGRYKLYAYKYNIYDGQLHNGRRALLYADSLLYLVKDKAVVWDTAHLFRAFMLKANASYRNELFDSAFKYYELAKDLALKSGSACEEFVYLFRISMVQFREEKFIESARLFKMAYATSTLCSRTTMEHCFRQQEILSNTGIAYGKAQMNDSSLHYYREALKFILERRDLFKADRRKWDEALSVVYGNIGSVFSSLKQTDSAELYFERSIALSRMTGRNIADRQYNLLKFADLLMDKGQINAAGDLLAEFDSVDKRLRLIRTTEENLEFDLRSTEVYARYYFDKHLYQEAISFIHRRDSVREEKWTVTNRILKNDLQNGMDNIGHEKQIISLEKDVRIRAQQNIILVLTIVLSLVVLLAIFSSFRKYKQKSLVLEDTNKKIKDESAKKEELLRRKIRQDELNFMALIENTDDFLWSVDREFNLLAFNKAYREYFILVFGVEPRTGTPDPVKMLSPERYAKLVDGYETVLAGHPYDIVEKGMSVNGNTPDVEVRFRPIRDEQGNLSGVSCFRRDITEYVRLITKLETSNKQLRDIAWVQSHKLRGPLATMIGILDYLSDPEVTDADREMMTASLLEKLEEMDKIIHEIVALSE